MLKKDTSSRPIRKASHKYNLFNNRIKSHAKHIIGNDFSIQLIDELVDKVKKDYKDRIGYDLLDGFQIQEEVMKLLSKIAGEWNMQKEIVLASKYRKFHVVAMDTERFTYTIESVEISEDLQTIVFMIKDSVLSTEINAEDLTVPTNIGG